MTAVSQGDKAKVRLLVAQGADINEPSGAGEETPLIAAARLGNIEIVRELVRSGADIDFNNKQNETALLAAARHCKSEIVRYLVEEGAEVNLSKNPDLLTPFMRVAQCNDLAGMKALILAGANVNERNRHGVTALILASFRNSPDVVRLLLDAGADIESRWRRGDTALYVAARQGHDDVVKVLISRGADINVRSWYDGSTPLMIAAAQGHYSTASILIAAGADVNARNNREATALTLTTQHGYDNISELLRESGAT
jgi:ankyrin repeat protein